MKLFLFLFLPLTLLVGCNSFTPAKSISDPKSELDANRQLWQSQNISSYRFNLDISCFCEYSDKMPFSIEVRNGDVVSVSDNTGEAITIIDESDISSDSFYDLNIFVNFYTVDKLYAYALNSISTADKVYFEYDSQLGIPTSMVIVWREDEADSGERITVTNFEVISK